MRWSTYRTPEGGEGVGVWSDGRLLAVPGESSLLAVIAADDLDEAAARAADPVPDGTTLLPPIPRPPSIRDFMAFEEHVVTASAAIGLTVDPLWYQQPVFYFTNPAALLGPDHEVAVPPGSEALDYELEIAAVIDREGRDVSPDEAGDLIAGYVLFCDWSARDLQGAEMRLNLGPRRARTSRRAADRGC